VTLRIEMLGTFLRLLFAPYGLNLLRDPRPQIAFFDRELWIAIGCIALWLVAIAIAWRERARTALVALLWIAAALAPLFVSLDKLGRCPISERFLYVSVFGAALLASDRIARIRSNAVAHAAVIALALASGLAFRGRTQVWRDEETLFTETVRASPKSPYAHWGLGRVLLGKFQSAPEDRKPAGVLNRALEEFVRSQDLGAKPDSGGAPDPSVLVTLDDRVQANLGYGWCILLCETYVHGECWGGEAEQVFGTIIAFDPQSAEAHVGLAMALALKNEHDRAIAELERATEINPRSKQAWFDRGFVEVRRGRFEEAAKCFERAHEIEPGDVATLVEWARSLADAGSADRALEKLDRARALAPNDPAAMLNTAIVLAKLERYPEALEILSRLLQIDGTFGPAHLERAKICASLGQLDRAAASFVQACKWMPSSFEAHYYFGKLLATRGAQADAIPYFERALALDPDGPHAEELKADIERAESSAGESSSTAEQH
jgi:tetratricopeptide (TPR) repeat protein